jgi:SAM-dependent methyltransferase
VRRLLAAAGRELTGAADRAAIPAPDPQAGAGLSGGPGASDDLYVESYFGVGRDAGGDRQGRSGYAVYDRMSSNADIAGWMLWRNFRVARTLDIGCATGFLVEVLRERGLDAVGSDVSAYAVTHPAPGAVGRLFQGDLATGLPFPDRAFDLVTALEVLEHVPPEGVPAAIAEIRRVAAGFVVATIPSLGRNLGGPDGHLEGKVRPDRVEEYRLRGDGFSGPVPPEDLAVDADGRPVEGHLTIASYGWWTERFEDAGFERRTDIERRLHRDLEPTGLNEHWNLYVFALPEVPDELAHPLRPDRTLEELGLRHILLDAHRQTG